MTKKKKLPLPQAMYLDNPEGGEQEMALLYARIETLKKHGEEAMSPHDIRNGYKPKTIIRMMTRQLHVMLGAVYALKKEATGKDAEWRDRLGTWRPLYLLRDEITHLEEELETMNQEIQMQDDEATTTKHPPRVEGEKEKQATPGGGALERLEMAAEIRKTVFLIKAQLKEIRKDAKEKIQILERGLAQTLDDLDSNQLTLFDVSTVSPDVEEIIDDPTL